MAIRNKTTNLYTEWKPLIDGLPNDEAGIIFKNILSYQNGDEVNNSNPIWIFIKSKIDEYNNKLNQISEKRKENGKLGGLAKASKCKQMLANDSKSSNKIKEKKIKENKTKQYNIELYNNLIIKYPNLKEPMERWLEYKKQRKENYTDIGLEDCFEKLQKLSSGDTALAMAIVKQSTSGTWSGLFPLKSQKQFERKKTQAELIDEHNLSYIEKIMEENYNG